MASRQEDPTTRIIKTDQASDSFVREALSDTIAVRLLNLRCQEAQEQHLPGQDYARLVSAIDGSTLSFCVCDGVGSSYKGDFAAWYLARQMVHWLGSMPQIAVEAKKIAPVLQNMLTTWSASGKAMLANHAIPKDTPGLLREVLEELRDTYGSETVFFAGRIDMATKGQQALLCWMGNVTAHLWTDAATPLILAGQGDDSLRWSTGRGVRGQVQVQTHHFPTLKRMIVYTDGVEHMASQIVNLTDDQLQEQTRQALLLPANDDMTVLDVQWGDGMPPAVPPEEIPHG